MTYSPFQDEAVKAVFEAYTVSLREPLLDMRELILRTHRETAEAGPLIETLKWGQPAYLTEQPSTGTTIRIDAIKGHQDKFAMFVHCQTRLIAAYRELYPDRFEFEGNRAIHFSVNRPMPEAELAHCISMALTYKVKPLPV